MPEPGDATNHTLLAFDYGRQRIGIAVGQTLTRTAQPLTTVYNHNGEPDWQAIDKLQQQWQAGTIIIGLPSNKDGTDNEVCRAVRNFAVAVEKRFHLPVHLVDERYSSASATAFLKAQRHSGRRGRQVRKEDIDKIAAAVILQSWLDDLSTRTRNEE